MQDRKDGGVLARLKSIFGRSSKAPEPIRILASDDPAVRQEKLRAMLLQGATLPDDYWDLVDLDMLGEWGLRELRIACAEWGLDKVRGGARGIVARATALALMPCASLAGAMSWCTTSGKLCSKTASVCSCYARGWRRSGSWSWKARWAGVRRAGCAWGPQALAQGSVYAFGAGFSGQLGLGDKESAAQPSLLIPLMGTACAHVAVVCCRAHHHRRRRCSRPCSASAGL